MLAGLAVFAPGTAAAVDEDVEAFARIVVAETDLRTGPGLSHRVITRAARGETFLIEGREGSGYWLRILLADGRRAYVLGDTVEPIGFGDDAADRPSAPGIFSPPALQEATAGFAILGGMYRRNGYVELKPAWLIAPAVAAEPYVGLALHSQGRALLYGLGGTLNVFPDWPVAPYVHLGGGGLRTDSKDEFVLGAEDVFHARAGGGLLISFRWRILVRLEAMNVVLFTEDSSRYTQSYTGGLGTYF